MIKIGITQIPSRVINLKKLKRLDISQNRIVNIDLIKNVQIY
jgi:Leucine-rich repeat (LRR) protein